MPRDFYVKPQFLAQSDAYLQFITAVVGMYNQSVDGGLTDDAISQVIAPILTLVVNAYLGF